MNRLIHVIFVLALVIVSTVVADAKPKIRIATDGFPTGQNTPEGAASDLARAFMKQDAVAFRSLCIRPYGAGQSRKDYEGYLNGVSEHFKSLKGRPDPDNPTKIIKVFAARHLTMNGPVSFGYAAADFQDIMFVDIEVQLRNGSKHLRRNLVIKDHDGKWYVHPVPDVSPLLSAGLFDEKPSVRTFTDVYDTEH